VLVLTLIVLASAFAMGARVGILYGVPVYSVGLFVCCLFCHGELAALRPAPRHLTAFYLMIALGGALGGCFVTLLAPLLFRGFDELYLGLIVCGSIAAAFSFTDPANRTAGYRTWNPFLPALVVVVLLTGVLFAGRLLQRAQPGLTERRSFYGTLRILDTTAPDGVGTMRLLTHGSTRHGQQFLDPERRGIPTTYYSRSSGIGMLLDDLSQEPPRRMGIVGLGAGLLAAYGRPGDTIRFYELNPQVIDVARSHFTFLKDSPANVEVVPGDARLSLEREEKEPPFDVLVVDAFSSDSIPVHLLTREAFELYFRRLTPGGVLALHLTTRHLDLGPQVAALARAAGKAAWEIRTAADDKWGILDARWILITSDAAVVSRPRLRDAARPPDVGNAPRLWTDDYSNLFQVLK
jgi:SAM-dependent methyltransferase